MPGEADLLIPGGGSTTALVGVWVLASLANILLGYDAGIWSVARLYVQDDIKLTTLEDEVIVGAVFLGSALGCLMASLLSDRLGRRLTLVVAATLFAAGGASVARATTVTALVVGRLVLGFAIGIEFVNSPLLLAEVTPTRWRGTAIAYVEVMNNVGIIVGFGAGWALSGARAWQGMMWVSVVVALVVLASAPFLPESPRWLALHGREEEAQATLARVMRPEDADFEWREIQRRQEEDARSERSPVSWRAWVVGIGVPVCSQLAGSEALVVYTPQLLEQGQQALSPLAGNLLVGATKTACLLVPLLLVDVVGRRSLMLVSSLGQAVAAGLLSYAMSQAPWLILPGLLLLIGSFSLGMSTLAFVIPAEVFPTHMRATGMGLALFSNRLVAGAIAGTYLSAVDSVGAPAAFGAYAACAVASVAFVAAVPETMRLSLEETGKMLGDEKKEP